MPHLPASALFFLLPFAAASHAQWQLHFRDDAPATSAEDQATLQRVQRLLKHYDKDTNPRLRFSFHHPAHAEARWQALRAQLPQLAAQEHDVYNRPDADLLHIELVARSPSDCPTVLIVQDPALPVGKRGLAIHGNAALALSADGKIRIQAGAAPFLAFAYQADSRRFQDLQPQVGKAFAPLRADSRLLIGMRRLEGNDDAARQDAETKLRHRLEKNAQRGKAMSLSPVPAAPLHEAVGGERRECFIQLRRL